MTLSRPSSQIERMPFRIAAVSSSSRVAPLRSAARARRSSRGTGRRRRGPCSRSASSGCSPPCGRSACRGRRGPARARSAACRDRTRSTSYDSRAVRAELPREPLGQHGRDGGAGDERLDAHLVQARDRARGVVRVQGREHEVSGEGGLDRDARGLAVADLADHDDVGVVAQDRAQRRGERQPGARVDLNLVGAVEPVLDRVLDGDDVDLGPARLGRARRRASSTCRRRSGR